MNKLITAGCAAVAAFAAAAAPTRAELERARPLVERRTSAELEAYRAGEKTAQKVAAAHLAFAQQAESPAEKYLLCQGAFKLYARCGEYGLAADAIQIMKRDVQDIQPEVIAEIIGDELRYVSDSKAPRLAAMLKEAKNSLTKHQLDKIEKIIIEGKDTIDGTIWSYRMQDGNVEIVGVSPQPKGHLTIPSTLNGHSVTSIGSESFHGCCGMVSVTIPPSVTNIEGRAFSYCKSLQSVTILGERPGASDDVFIACGSLKAIHVPATAKSWAGMTEWLGKKLVFGAKAEDGVTAEKAKLGEVASRRCNPDGAAAAESRPQRPNGVKDLDRRNLPKLWSAPGVTEHVLKQGDGADDLVFVECPAGDFTMGFSKEKGSPFYAHRVTLTYSFWMLKTPLTQGQSYVPGICNDGMGGRCARSAWSYAQVTAYLGHLNRKFAAQIPPGCVIRFPTFAEYQYAYRANATDPKDPYSSDMFQGDDAKRICLDNGTRKQWLGIQRTWTRVWPAEVGLLEPNAWGLYDMAGNGFPFLCDRVNNDLPRAEHFRYAEHETDPILYEEDANVVLLRSPDGGGACVHTATVVPFRWAFTYRLVVGPDLERKGRERVARENLARHDKFHQGMLAQLSNRKTGPDKPGEVKVMELAPGQRVRFVTCPAGTFTMGHEFTTGPFHRRDVTISRPFLMAEERLTMGMWFAYLEANGKRVPEERRLYAKKRGGERSALCGISANEWLDFLRWLNGTFAQAIPEGYVFRLPTEAEWEYAYRAGSNRRDDPFAWTTPFVGSHAAAAQPYAYTEDERRADFIRIGRGCVTDTLGSACGTDWRRLEFVDPGVVGTKKPNAWGFKDMIGNGREFVLDRFKGAHGSFPAEEYSKDAAVTDPVLGYALDNWDCQMFRGGEDGYAGRKCWEITCWETSEWSYLPKLYSYRLVIGPDLIAEKRARF